MRSPRSIVVFTAASMLVCAALLPTGAKAWTETKLSGVSVSLAVTPRGPSTATTQARFEVRGGKFHGFTLAPMPGAELIATECGAATDEGRVLPLSYRPLPDGRVRVLFDGDTSLSYGAVTYTLVHRVDLVASGALRRHGARARLDWAPIVWDSGTEVMTVEVLLPGEGAAPPTAVPAVTEDYEVSSTAAGIRLVKYRTVRWYSMRVAIDFGAELVPGLADDGRPSGDTASAVAAATSRSASSASSRTPPPPPIALAPVLATLLGFALALRKSTRVGRAIRDLGIEPRYLLIPSTGTAARLVLSALAVGLGLFAQHLGSIAAGVPAFAVAVGLWILRHETGAVAARVAGAWREMSEDDVARYRRLGRAYTARRTSLVDISHPRGMLAFAAAVAALGAAFVAAYDSWPRLAIAVALNGAIWVVPAWFTNNRNELPADPILESFLALRRWRRVLNRIAGSRLAGTSASFFVREDDSGPTDIRLRVAEPLPEGIHGIEVAGELVRAGARLRRRPAVVLRLEPGSEIARRLAACPNAVEHHLSPDLKDEVIVLRNRRGKAPEGLASLRHALSLISA